MNDPSSKISFLAVLIYEDRNFGDGWRCEEPRVYCASHPEIAYQAALADGNEQRFAKMFQGLSHLEQTTASARSLPDGPGLARERSPHAALETTSRRR